MEISYDKSLRAFEFKDMKSTDFIITEKVLTDVKKCGFIKTKSNDKIWVEARK